MRSSAPFALAFALIATTIVGPGRAESTTCGAPGKPPCPLQRWMRQNAAAPLATQKPDALARAFEQMVKLNPKPDGWQNWNKIAEDGAEAVRAGDWRAARSACGRCHRAYRRGYNLHYRERALPEQ